MHTAKLKTKLQYFISIAGLIFSEAVLLCLILAIGSYVDLSLLQVNFGPFDLGTFPSAIIVICKSLTMSDTSFFIFSAVLMGLSTFFPMEMSKKQGTHFLTCFCSVGILTCLFLSLVLLSVPATITAAIGT
jgi:hypothetical protein